MARRSAIHVGVLVCVLASAGSAWGQDVPQFPALRAVPAPVPPTGPSTSFQLPIPPELPDDPRPDPITPGEQLLVDGSRVNLPGERKQLIRWSPRYGTLGKFDFVPIGDNTQRLVYTGGLIVNVLYEVSVPGGKRPQEYEFAADNVVIWVKNLGNRTLQSVDQVNPNDDDRKLEIELYMAGNVVVRSQETTVSSIDIYNRTTTSRVLRADQVYYDVTNNKAIALQADLELTTDRLLDKLHIGGDRIERLGPNEWRGDNGSAYSSKLPSDPKIRFGSRSFEFYERLTDRRNFLGLPYRQLGTFERDYGPERTLVGRGNRISVLGVPIFYTPYYKGDPTEPLGPLQGIGIGNDGIFGVQVYTDWDLYKLLAIRAPQRHKWRLQADYLGDRGPGFGTTYDYRNTDFFGFGGENFGTVRLYGLNDGGTDRLAGDRGPEPPQSTTRRDGERIFRGRALWRHQQVITERRDEFNRLTDGPYVTLQRQFAYQSDKNFLEVFNPIEFNTQPNQETFVTLTASARQFSGSLFVQTGQDRNWVSETQWLPHASAAVVGQSLFDLFTLNSRVEGGYARMRPAQVSPPAVLPTENRFLEAGRVDWFSELSLPFSLGAVRLAPYGVFNLTGYSEDLTGQQRGRVYGGGGVRSSFTLSRVFTDARSELFNVNGLNHKATFHANYFTARSNVSHTDLPLFDRLNDDYVDQTYRSVVLKQRDLLPRRVADLLTTSPIFNPQRYAIRRLVDNRVDTRDDIDVVQLGLDQRLQTKRGMPGREHTIDWFALDLSTSLFPRQNRDNFGKTAAFFEYNALWNIGDETSLTSAGWFDPFDTGARYFAVQSNFSRSNGTNFSLGYRQTDPVNSRAVVASVGYQLTKKYAVSFLNIYDFGTTQALINQFMLTRVGTDLTVSVGITYSQQLDNLGVQLSIVPNFLAGTGFGRFGSPFFSRQQ